MNVPLTPKENKLRQDLYEYIEKLEQEDMLYREELKEALKEYREKRKPFIKIHSAVISLADFPLVAETIINTHFMLAATVSSSWRLYKDWVIEKIKRREAYLESLPGAKERMPQRPASVDNWMSEK